MQSIDIIRMLNMNGQLRLHTRHADTRKNKIFRKLIDFTCLIRENGNPL